MKLSLLQFVILGLYIHFIIQIMCFFSVKLHHQMFPHASLFSRKCTFFQTIIHLSDTFTPQHMLQLRLTKCFTADSAIGVGKTDFHNWD